MPESSSKNTARNDSGEIATSTLAEIYAQQGLLGRALSIYRRMLARAPEDAVIADRIRSLEVRMAEVGPEPPADPAFGSQAGRERLPWDPPEPEAAAPVDEDAATAEPGSEAETLTLETEPEPEPEPELPPVATPRKARIDAAAFRSWLDGR